MLLNDFSLADVDGARAHDATAWRLISDRVMGGVSDGRAVVDTVGGRRALRLTGRVRLENDGGFVQIARDLAPDGAPIDLSGFAGLELEVLGNGEGYGVHLRTRDVTRPWQSYRAGFVAAPEWTRLRLPFAGFRAHRIETPLDLSGARRIGLVAIGRAFDADLALARLSLYR
ncbi:CIA30 family protein [Salinarimonas rosea]|uniref:CIA30 family protein n=1 Tax=Salinarimonas rosea TaxID=552063 RepID=UPI0004172AB1|nr:CIA30 family protein [Salinarimonas rosea]